MGCTQMTFFNWQEGKNLPSYDNLLRLAGILKIPLEKIVVFKKFTEEKLPLKETNSGFIRNNVFFTYNRATECVLRDCMVFKKKYDSYPDQLILSSKALENWKKREKEEEAEAAVEAEETLPDYNSIPDLVPQGRSGSGGSYQGAPLTGADRGPFTGADRGPFTDADLAPLTGADRGPFTDADLAPLTGADRDPLAGVDLAPLTGELALDEAGKERVRTLAFSIEIILKEDMPEHYYRLIKAS
ncbi:MAG: hypothetical protein K5930_08900 [Treponemataceae bacterium]|nr:hypothetical protein [Treponemataceae bacterium]